MFLRHVLSGLPSFLAGVLFLSAIVSGCGRNSVQPPVAPQPREVYASMMDDPDFLAQLKTRREVQKKILGERARVEKRMLALVAEAKTACGKTDDASVKTELEGNPAKYPEWNPLYARIEELNREYEKNVAGSREIARVRIAREAQDRADIAAGKACAKAVEKEIPTVPEPVK